jgi:phage baseplate assembly protein W
MGNVKITTLPKAREYVREFAFADLHLDIETSFSNQNEVYALNNQKDVVVDYDIRAIKNSIVNIFTTSPGEKILNPTFGLDLRDYLFEPVSDIISSQISSAISAGLRNQEPRIRFTRPPEVISNPEEQSYTINMIVNVPLLDISDFLFQGLLNFQGFSIINI